MVTLETAAFLKNVPPFQFLEDKDLNYVAKNVTLEFYPKGTVIIPQNSPPSETLRVIKKGSVKLTLTTPTHEEILMDHRAEGETFGFLSLVSQEPVRTNVIAAEDTLCYVLGKELLLKLLSDHLSFMEYFLKFNVTKYVDRTYKDIQSQSALYGLPERVLFTTPIGAICTREIVSVSLKNTIQQAAILMGKHRISSVVVIDEGGRNPNPIGLITEREFRENVVAKNADVSLSVQSMMNTSLVRLDERETCFEATLQMVKHGVRHILVMSGGALVGILTHHDLILLQGKSPLSLAKDIDGLRTINEVVATSKRITPIIGLLLKEGAKAGHIVQIITEMNDRLVKKIIQLTEAEVGPPPLPYCWLAFGSEGRKEQTFKTDQDNAIVYADPSGPEEVEKAAQYFPKLAELIRDRLLLCGFPLCPGQYMAANPKWCQPLYVWKKYFSHWITEPTAEALLNALTVFDFRGVSGDLSLAAELRKHLNTQLKDQIRFFGHLANYAIRNTPPVGFLKSFIVEKGGQHKDQFNLKVKGVAPLIDIVRLFSLDRAISETSTLERLAELKKSHSLIGEFADDIAQAFEFILLLRIHHQYRQVSAGGPPDNFINPDHLSHLEKRSLKEAFHLVSELQGMLVEKYKALIW